jgi:ankyrin repeat protein
MPPPQLPLEILIMIARHLLADTEDELRFANFNSFLRVNCAIYACLNRTLWEEAVESTSATKRVFTHLISTNNLSRLEFFLELGADVDIILPEFNSQLTKNIDHTPLLVAAQLDNVPMARLFLEHGADVVQLDYSAIHAARSAEMVQLLLDHDADPEQEHNGYRPLHLYILRDNIEALRAILRHGVEVVPPMHWSCAKPLHDAARRNIDAVKLLLEHGADVKMRGQYAETLLHSAVRGGKTDVVRLLLELWPEGASKTNTSWQTPLHFAVAKGKTDMARSLLEIWPEGTREKDIHGNTPLHYAAADGVTDTARLLLESFPAGAREKAKYKHTPLHLAAREGWTDMVRLLVECWPEGQREKDRDGNTPLHLAVAGGRTDAVRLLVELWPEGQRAREDYGEIPLHLAARKGQTDVLRLLLERWPAGTREKSKGGKTPLHAAAWAGKADAVRLLVEHWPDGTREKAVYGNTPLHLAAYGGSVEAVRLLVESWPEGKEALNEDGQTPLSIFFEEHANSGIHRGNEIIALLGGLY